MAIYRVEGILKVETPDHSIHTPRRKQKSGRYLTFRFHSRNRTLLHLVLTRQVQY